MTFDVTFAGNLVKEPELRFTPSGTAVTDLVIVTKERKYDRDSGGWKDGEGSFWDVTVWDKQGQASVERLVKGDTVLVKGKILKEAYEVDGQKRYRVKVVADHVGKSLKWEETRGEAIAAGNVAGNDEEPPF